MRWIYVVVPTVVAVFASFAHSQSASPTTPGSSSGVQGSTNSEGSQASANTPNQEAHNPTPSGTTGADDGSSGKVEDSISVRQGYIASGVKACNTYVAKVHQCCRVNPSAECGGTDASRFLKATVATKEGSPDTESMGAGKSEDTQYALVAMLKQSEKENQDVCDQTQETCRMKCEELAQNISRGCRNCTIKTILHVKENCKTPFKFADHRVHSTPAQEEKIKEYKEKWREAFVDKHSGDKNSTPDGKTLFDNTVGHKFENQKVIREDFPPSERGQDSPGPRESSQEARSENEGRGRDHSYDREYDRQPTSDDKGSREERSNNVASDQERSRQGSLYHGYESEARMAADATTSAREGSKKSGSGFEGLGDQMDVAPMMINNMRSGAMAGQPRAARLPASDPITQESNSQSVLNTSGSNVAAGVASPASSASARVEQVQMQGAVAGSAGTVTSASRTGQSMPTVKFTGETQVVPSGASSSGFSFKPLNWSRWIPAGLDPWRKPSKQENNYRALGNLGVDEGGGAGSSSPKKPAAPPVPLSAYLPGGTRYNRAQAVGGTAAEQRSAADIQYPSANVFNQVSTRLQNLCRAGRLYDCR